MKLRYLFISSLLVALTACSSAYRIADAYQLSKCTYDFNSVSGVKVANIDLSNGISLASIGQLTPLLTGTSTNIPLEMVVNLSVKNPTEKKAAINKMSYQIYFDDQHIADGSSTTPFTVEANQTGVLPLKVSCNIEELFTGATGTASLNIIKNLIGISSDPTKITLKVKPTFLMGTTEVPMPGYIPISFTLDNKKVN